jgi:hypothetical protein
MKNHQGVDIHMDVFNNADGNIAGECVLSLPYSQSQMEMFRNLLSLAEKAESDAHQERDVAYKDWADCKAKLFCNARPKDERLEEKEAAHDVAKIELERAQSELSRAERANLVEQNRYDDCYSQRLVFLQEQAKVDAELEKVRIAEQTEQQKVGVEQSKVATSQIEAKKDYMVIGAVGVGIVSLMFISYLMLSK